MYYVYFIPWGLIGIVVLLALLGLATSSTVLFLVKVGIWISIILSAIFGILSVISVLFDEFDDSCLFVKIVKVILILVASIFMCYGLFVVRSEMVASYGEGGGIDYLFTLILDIPFIVFYCGIGGGAVSYLAGNDGEEASTAKGILLMLVLFILTILFIL